MAKLIKMPVLGQSVEEVRILRWFKNEGDTVAQGEPLVEIETDKVNHEVESPESGVVRRHLAEVDSFLAVGAPVAIIGDASEPIEDLLGEAKRDAPFPGPSPTRGGRVTDGADAAPVSDVSSSLPPRVGEGPGKGASLFASPRARRIADERGVSIAEMAGRGSGPGGRIVERDVVAYHEEAQAAADSAQTMAGRGPKASPLARAVASGAGLDLSAVPGSGMGGRITADDVRQATVPASPAPSAAATGGVRTVTLTGLRKRVADNVAKSVRTAPHVTLNLSADMSAAMRLRQELMADVEKASGGVRLSPTDVIVKAVAGALREFPYMNAHIDGDTMTLFEDVHIGLAVSLGEEGLIVPVIHDAGRKGLSEIARDRQDLAGRARSNALTSADISGGTFTITNLGSYGIESFNPVINPPQVAILGVGAIADQVVAIDGAPAVRPMMGLSLSFDHRAIDGAPAAAYLARVREILETPTLLLL